LLRANDITPPSAPPIRRKKNIQSATMRISGIIQPMSPSIQRLTNSPV
jgi:hypothetical protein